MYDGQPTLRRKPAGWPWLRALVAVWFAFYINFVPIHLVSQAHLDDVITEGVHVDSQGAALTQGDTENHNDHALHFASDHLLRFVSQAQACGAALDVVQVETDVRVLTSQPQARLFLTERQNPPGLPPPDPFQPRGPPLA